MNCEMSIDTKRTDGEKLVTSFLRDHLESMHSFSEALIDNLFSKHAQVSENGIIKLKSLQMCKRKSSFKELPKSKFEDKNFTRFYEFLPKLQNDFGQRIMKHFDGDCFSCGEDISDFAKAGQHFQLLLQVWPLTKFYFVFLW